MNSAIVSDGLCAAEKCVHDARHQEILCTMVSSCAVELMGVRAVYNYTEPNAFCMPFDSLIVKCTTLVITTIKCEAESVRTRSKTTLIHMNPMF